MFHHFFQVNIFRIDAHRASTCLVSEKSYGLQELELPHELRPHVGPMCCLGGPHMGPVCYSRGTHVRPAQCQVGPTHIQWDPHFGGPLSGARTIWDPCTFSVAHLVDPRYYQVPLSFEKKTSMMILYTKYKINLTFPIYMKIITLYTTFIYDSSNTFYSLFPVHKFKKQDQLLFHH